MNRRDSHSIKLDIDTNEIETRGIFFYKPANFVHQFRFLTDDYRISRIRGMKTIMGGACSIKMILTILYDIKSLRYYRCQLAS